MQIKFLIEATRRRSKAKRTCRRALRLVGAVMRERILMPELLRPMTPTTSPFSISKLTPLSAQKLNGVGMRIRATQLARDPALDLIDQHLAVDDPKAVFF
jgi:hypothetical protein